MRTFPNVPRIMTSWLPRREPKVLKSIGCTPRPNRYVPTGSFFGIAPAGEMWSVVTESPSTANTRAPRMSSSAGACAFMPTKNGGFAM